MSRLVRVSFDVPHASDVDLTSLKRRVIRIIDDNEEEFAEARAIYHGDDFESWRPQVARAESFEALVALFAAEEGRSLARFRP
jgi:hypothetical protein